MVLEQNPLSIQYLTKERKRDNLILWGYSSLCFIPTNLNSVSSKLLLPHSNQLSSLKLLVHAIYGCNLRLATALAILILLDK